MTEDDKKAELIAAKYQEIMNLLGVEEKDTARRVAKSLMEMTHSVRRPIEDIYGEMTYFPNNFDGLLEVDDIHFSSICAHHHLPFFGKASILYKPSAYILGLSKFARIVNYYSKMPQTQEELTQDIGTFLRDQLDPKQLQVRLYDVTHTCMECRGVRSFGAKTSTTYEHRRDL